MRTTIPHRPPGDEDKPSFWVSPRGQTSVPQGMRLGITARVHVHPRQASPAFFPQSLVHRRQAAQLPPPAHAPVPEFIVQPRRTGRLHPPNHVAFLGGTQLSPSLPPPNLSTTNHNTLHVRQLELLTPFLEAGRAASFLFSTTNPFLRPTERPVESIWEKPAMLSSRANLECATYVFYGENLKKAGSFHFWRHDNVGF